MDDDVKSAYLELSKMRKEKMGPPSVAGKRPGRIASTNSPFLGINQVLELVPVSRSMLYLMLSKNEFPKPKALGVRSIAWSKQEVMEWIKEKLA